MIFDLNSFFADKIVTKAKAHQETKKEPKNGAKKYKLVWSNIACIFSVAYFNFEFTHFGMNKNV